MALRGTIDDFKASVVNDFARPNLFQVDLNFPATLGISSDLSTFGNFTVRAANLPASQIGVVEVPFRGRVLKIAGDRTFEPWTITVMNDSGFNMRNAFELWANSIQAANENFTAAGTLGDATDSTGYFADMLVHQLSRDIKTLPSLRFETKKIQDYKTNDFKLLEYDPHPTIKASMNV